MNVEEYIASGILELYVAGVLSGKENQEVDRLARQHPEIQEEIAAIERVMLRVTKAASPGMPLIDWNKITAQEVDFQPSRSLRATSWTNYLGWAAAVLFAAGMLWMFVQNSQLKSTIEIADQEKQTLEEQILSFRETLNSTESTLNSLRDKNVTVVALTGQEASPAAFAKVYWNPSEEIVYLDALGLPDPPSGFTYQAWSLKLDPLTPTSIGTLDNFVEQENRLFELFNPNPSEAFGITLEPAGGSDSPTLENLYTLGTVGP